MSRSQHERMINQGLKGVPKSAAPSQAVLSAALQQSFELNLSLPKSLSHRRLFNGALRLNHHAARSDLNTHPNFHSRADQSERGNSSLSAGSPPSSPSLAQRIGIAPKNVKMTSQAWEEAHEASRRRQYSQYPCPICQEEFKLEPQALLSCSHVFHQVCIHNFERFSQVRCCPICRTENYEKMLIDDGADWCRAKAALLIQRVFRGYLVRRVWWKQLPRSQKRLEKQKNFCIHKLSTATNRLLHLMESKDNDLDELFAECDHALALARSTLEEASHSFAPLSDSEWDAIRFRATERGVQECPICMVSFAKQPEKPVMLLSCSHLFHHNCLSCFEQFATASNGNTGCPICRASYQKQAYHPYTPKDEE